MKELTERLRALRTDARLESVFDDRTTTAEYQKTCTVVEIGFAKV